MREGDIVRLRAYGGREIDRLIVAVRPGVLVVTTVEEFRRAQSERREPVCVGFPVEDAIGRVGTLDGGETAA